MHTSTHQTLQWLALLLLPTALFGVIWLLAQTRRLACALPDRNEDMVLTEAAPPAPSDISLIAETATSAAATPICTATGSAARPASKQDQRRSMSCPRNSPSG